MAARHYAQVRIGPLYLGIAASHVRHALPRPADLLPMPPGGGALAGVFSYQGQAVPLIDLRRCLNQPADTDCPYMVVLAADGRLAALAVDAIASVREIEVARIEQVSHSEDADHFFRYVARPAGDDKILNLLEPERLMRRAQAWSDQAGPHAALDVPGALAAAGDSVSLATFELSGRVLALPSTLIAAVLPCPPLDTVFGWNGQLAGVIHWRGREVYVINSSMFDGVLPAPAVLPPLLAVLERDGRCLGMRVDRTLAVAAVPSGQIQYGTDGPCTHALVAATVTAPSGPPQLVLDDAALMALCPQASRASTPLAPAVDTCSADAYIVCDAGAELALPMASIVTIIVPPADMQAPTFNATGAPDGSCTWQGRMLPLIALGPHGPPIERIVVLEHGARQVGVVVRNLVTLVPAHSALKLSYRQFGGGTHTVITVDTPAGQASYRVLDPATLTAPGVLS